MIIAQQVQDTVDQQGLQLLRQRMAAPPRLARRGFDGDDDIAQQRRLERVGERKRQDVSRFVLPPVPAVQGVNLGVRHQGQAEFGLRLVQVLQNRPDPPP